MPVRSTRETMISVLCCAVAGLALAGGMQIAASPTPGGASARLSGDLAMACAVGAACEQDSLRADSAILLAR